MAASWRVHEAPVRAEAPPAEARTVSLLAAYSGPLASRETTRLLLREYHERRDFRARERVIQQYLPLVKSLARRFGERGEQYEDLVQVGSIGLIKAVDRFDLDRGVDLATFAIPTIVGEIKRHLRDRGWPIKVPRRLQEIRVRVRARSADLTAQLDRPATLAEVARDTGIRQEDAEAALATERLQAPPMSLSEDPEVTDGEPSAGVDGGFELGEDRVALAAGFRVLDDRERRVVHLRFFEEWSQSQIAREVGISKIHVSRLTTRALDKMRAEIGVA
ncbi:MAG TPA: sigma-70 family RNA polymerase sigma factor [Gaiellaceae bacterium]|nr:sigma-70 family RNA polymerase sigma factor [Gaiellaceae bacterium]